MKIDHGNDQLEKLQNELDGLRKSDRALRAILQALQSSAGPNHYFQSLVTQLARAANVNFAFASKLCDTDHSKLETLAFFHKDRIAKNFSYSIAGTPCETVFGNKLQYYRSKAWKTFPDDQDLKNMQIECYIGAPLFDSSGEPIGILALMHNEADVEYTDEMALIKVLASFAQVELERQILIERIKNEKKSAEFANRLKDVFLANISHEIRTPLTSIIGYAQHFLQDNPSPEQVAMANEVIIRNGNHLLNLVDDLIDLSKIEAGEFSMDFMKIDPKELAENAIDSIRKAVNDKGVEISFRLSNETPHVYSDATRVFQILLNILENAVKYTQEGFVRLESGFQSIDDKDYAFYRVSDSGIGIKDEEKERIFDSFYRSERKEKKTIPGTGLGLALVKRLVEMLEGKIEIKSEFGVGTEVIVVIPTIHSKLPDGFEESSDLEREDEAGVDAQVAPMNCRVLLADDCEDICVLFESILSSVGVEVDSVNNGRGAIKKICEVAGTPEAYDLVFMDIQMPIMDGIEAAREIRARGIETPIAALTAYALSNDRDKCMSAGCDDFLTKPVNRMTIVETMKRHVPGIGNESIS